MVFKREMGLVEGRRWDGQSREGFMEEVVSGLGLLSDLIGKRNSLGGQEDPNKSLEKGKDCVASWKPQLPH